MKTVFTILFLCSAAGSQVKTVHQSSKQPRCFVYSRHAMTQCLEDKDEAARMLAQEDRAVSQKAAPAQSSEPITVGSATFNIEAYRPKTFVVVDGAKRILEINTDTGEVTYGPGVTVTEASHKFYEEVGKLFGNKPCDATDMGRKPHRKSSIDRIDNDGNYEPSNCRWATVKQQARNKRGLTSFRIFGENMCAAEMADRYGVDPQKLRHLLLRRPVNGKPCPLLPMDALRLLGVKFDNQPEHDSHVQTIHREVPGQRLALVQPRHQ